MLKLVKTIFYLPRVELAECGAASINVKFQDDQ